MKRSSRPVFGKLSNRRGATIVEMAIVGPAAFLLLITIMAGGFGVFRYQQVSSLARMGARWAALHGPKYQREAGQPAPTASDVFVNAIQPKAVSLDEENLHCQLEWNADATEVSVRLTYEWTKQAFFGKLTFTSNATSPVIR